MRFAPACLVAGIDSPVTIDSSIDDLPSTRTPSTGTRSPGRTRIKSPTATASSGTSSSLPSGRTRRALVGVSVISARIALKVEARARSSKTCPSSTSTVIIAAASK